MKEEKKREKQVREDGGRESEEKRERVREERRSEGQEKKKRKKENFVAYRILLSNGIRA